MLRLSAILALLLLPLLPPAPGAAGDKPPAPAATPSDLPKRIDAAVRKGRGALLATLGYEDVPDAPVGLASGGKRTTPIAGVKPPDNGKKRNLLPRLGNDPQVWLTLHALLHAGLPQDHPLVQDWLAHLPEVMIVAKTGTYEASLAALVLTDLHDPSPNPDLPGRDFRKPLQELADALVAGQGPHGSWGYPLAQGRAEGLPVNENNSTLQYALLGLQSASRTGARVPDLVWRNAATFLLKDQRKNGGWGYGRPGPGTLPCNAPYGSMTAVGVTGLMICAQHLEDKDGLRKRIQPALAEGMDWLALNFETCEVPGATWDLLSKAVYYYLYSVERAGSFAKVETFGRHSWYPDGATFLLKQQEATGAWPPSPGESRSLTSAFALLFLSRASRGMLLPYTVEDAPTPDRPSPKP